MVQMTETQAKKELTPDQITERNIKAMPNPQMSKRLKRLAEGRGLTLKKSPLSNIDSTWAIVLSLIFDNTSETGGKMEPYLR
jgi:hypothetical protein